MCVLKCTWKYYPQRLTKAVCIRQLIKILLSFLSRSGQLLLSNIKDSLALAMIKVIVYKSFGELVYVLKGTFKKLLLPLLYIPGNWDKTNFLLVLSTMVPMELVQLIKCTFFLVNRSDHSQQSNKEYSNVKWWEYGFTT